MVCLHSVPQPRRMFNNDPIGVLNISPLLAAHSMPPSTNLAGPHSQESPLRPPDCELYFHNNSFAEGNHIEKPTRLNMVHPATSQQNAPHMLLSDTHMSSIIDTQSPLGNPSISLRDNALFESMDHLLPLWYGESWSPDDGIGQRPHFPAVMTQMLLLGSTKPSKSCIILLVFRNHREELAILCLSQVFSEIERVQGYD